MRYWLRFSNSLYYASTGQLHMHTPKEGPRAVSQRSAHAARCSLACQSRMKHMLSYAASSAVS